MIDLLINSGANLNCVHNTLGTPLHIVVCKGNFFGVRVLLMAGVRIDIENGAGETVLDLERKSGCLSLLRLLNSDKFPSYYSHSRKYSDRKHGHHNDINIKLSDDSFGEDTDSFEDKSRCSARYILERKNGRLS